MLASLNAIFGHCVSSSEWENAEAYAERSDVIQACLRVYEVTDNHEACEVRVFVCIMRVRHCSISCIHACVCVFTCMLQPAGKECSMQEAAVNTRARTHAGCHAAAGCSAFSRGKCHRAEA